MTSKSVIESWVRRAERHDVELAAMARRSDGTNLPVKLRNISYDGCLLEADTVLSIGEKLVIELPQMGAIRSQIRWASMDGKAGARFLSDELPGQPGTGPEQ